MTTRRSKLLACMLLPLLVLLLAPAAYAQITVSTFDDELNSDGDCSLREAIQAANSDSAVDACAAGSGADTITLPAGTYTLSIGGLDEDANVTGDLDITTSLSISGAGARTTIIDANNIDRVFHIPSGATVTITGVTIQNGNASGIGGGATAGADGGGILVSGPNASLTLNDSRVTSNVAFDEGGGVHVDAAGATVTVNRSLIDNNQATAAPTATSGGIGAFPNGSVIINNSTISGNTARFGGAAQIQTSGSFILINTTVTGNSFVGGNTAGLRVISSTTLQNSIVSGNGTSDCLAFVTITSNGFNIVGSNGSANNCPSSGTGDQILAGAISTLLDTNLADNGGPTDTHALVGGSPALDAIPNGTSGCGTTYTDDQRGAPRPEVASTDCDAGAVEGTSFFSANTPPTADAGGPYSGDEGSAIALSGATASDDDGDALTYTWTVDSALCSFDDASALNPDLTCTDNGTFTATLSVDDGTADPVTDDATVNVANVDPEVGAVTVPTDPIDINDQPVTGVSAPYSDDGANDSHTCTVDYDDGTGPQPGTTDGSTCTGPDHTYTEVGVYAVTVEVTDDDGGSGSSTATTFIVIYDPDGGFVTGGGWIDSPAEACQFGACTDETTGKANFGFVSKYKKGASTPTGQTEFNFKAGNLNFHSTSYDWLVIAGAKAMYKGDGTVNGDEGFSFQLNAIDGQQPGGGGVDRFRIKIKQTGGGVIYDNQMGAGDNDDPTTELGGGQIKIHQSGGNNRLGDGASLPEAQPGEVQAEVPAAFALEAAYPNPFNPQTTLRFDVPASAEVSLVVYDVLGRQVRVLVDGQVPAGTHEVVFEAGNLPSGTYLVRLVTPQGSFTRTMHLVK